MHNSHVYKGIMVDNEHTGELIYERLDRTCRFI